MSHADRISQHYNSRNDLDLSSICRYMTDEIGMRIIEFVRTYDPSDVSYMPHVFPAKLDRWAYIAERIATHQDDPVSALELSVKAIPSWSREYDRAANFDWDYKTWIYIGNDEDATRVSMFEKEKLLYVERGIPNPEAALQEGIAAQKEYGLKARNTAVTLFCKLAKQFPGEAVAVLDKLPQEKRDRMQDHLSGTLDVQAFRTELAASIPPGYALKPKIANPLPKADFF